MHHRLFFLMLLTLFTLNSHANQPILQLDTGGHTSLIRDVTFTPDGRYLVSASDDKTIRVWDWRTGKTVRFLRGQMGKGREGKIYAMALSPNGRWLAVGGFMRDDEIRLYDFHSGELTALLRGHSNAVLDLAFSPDSQKLVSGSADNSAIIWHIASQRRLQQLKGHTDDIYAVAFTADNQRVVTGSDDHSLRLWQVEQGELLATLQGHSDKVRAIAISPKGDLIASGSWDHTIRLWDARSGEFKRTLANQGTQVGSLSFSADGQRLLSGIAQGKNNDCHIWDIASGKKLQTFQHDNVVIATTFSPNGRYAVTAGGNKREIQLWDSRNGKTVQTLRGQGAAVWSVGFAANGQAIAWGKKGHAGDNAIGTLQNQLTLSQTQSSLGTPRPLQAQTWQRAQTRSGDWSLQSQQGGNYGYQAILAIQHQGKTKARIERDPTSGYDHRSYTFTPNGQAIISGGMSGVLSLYQRNGKKRGDFIGHTGDVWAVAVSPNGKYLLSGSDDQTVRLWRIDSQELLLTLFTGDSDDWIAWTPQGYYTGSPNGDSLIGWQINRGVDKAADFATAAQLRQHFYRPDIIDATIRLGSAKQAVAQASNTHFSLADLLRKGLPPKFVLSQPEEGATVGKVMQDITLSFAADAKAESLEAYVNGVQVISRGKMVLPQQSNGYQRTLTLPLQSGKNAIRIVAHNAIGKTERDFFLTLNDPSKKQQGRLFLVAIGVSDYNDNSLDLNFAAKDAIAFQQRLAEQAKKSYSDVKTVLLADGHQTPTSSNIQDALDLFREATPNDTVVLFLSGHGVNQGADYYFLSQNAEKSGNSWRSSSVVKWNILFDALASTNGQRIMFVDTCHAGNAFNPRLLNDTDDKNIVVISATDSQNVSFEQRELGHGVFTYALLEGMAGKADALDNNQQITLKELDAYLSNRIPKLTNGAQTPVLNVPGGFKDFSFMRL